MNKQLLIMKNMKSLLLALLLCMPLTATADVEINEANFPDSNFRAYLLKQGYGADSVLTETEIKGITSINVFSKNISSLKGIEHFTALTDLSCNGNQIKGESMDALIGSMPQSKSSSTGFSFRIYDNSKNDEGNVITKSQVATAKAKGWTPLYYDGKTWKEYEGSEDGTDGYISIDSIYYILYPTDQSATVTYKSKSDRGYKGVVNIPDKVTYGGMTYAVTAIGDSTFYNCSGVTEVKISNSIISIGKYAFDSCSGLTELTIPNSVAYIDEGAFISCVNLRKVIIGDGVTYIGDRAFYKTAILELTIGNSVTFIGDYAFIDTRLTKLIIPNSVTHIGEGTFNYSPTLTELIIGNSVTSIGDRAFSSCSSLKSIISLNTIPPIIKDSTFNKTIKQNVTLYVPAGCKALYKQADGWKSFYNIQEDGADGIDRINIGGIYYILNQSDNTAIVTYKSTYDRGYSGVVNIPEKVMYEGMVYTVTAIGDSTFYKCDDLTELVIGECVTDIGKYAVSGCSRLTEVTIPNSVMFIAEGAFFDNRRLEAVTIGSCVTEIGEYGFYYCYSIASVVSLNPIPPVICEKTFEMGVRHSATLYVPVGSKTLYERVDVWKGFFNIQEDSTDSIPDISAKKAEAEAAYKAAMEVYEQYMFYYKDGMESWKAIEEAWTRNFAKIDGIEADIKTLLNTIAESSMADADKAAYGKALNEMAESVSGLYGRNKNASTLDAFNFGFTAEKALGDIKAYESRLVAYKERTETAATANGLDVLIAEMKQDAERMQTLCLNPVVCGYEGLQPLMQEMSEIGKELNELIMTLYFYVDAVNDAITGISDIGAADSEIVTVYTIDGKKQVVKKHDLNLLSKGLYIINGKKLRIEKRSIVYY